VKNTGDKQRVLRSNSRITLNFSDSEAICQSNEVLQPSKNTNSTLIDKKKQLMLSRAEESEEYR